jgi:hypothetical protein
MMPAAAPEDEHQSIVDASEQARVSPSASIMAPPSPSTLRSNSPTEWSSTDGSSIWDDARPRRNSQESLRRRDSQEFILVEDESDEGH